jgi:hypothetical protein
LKNVGRLNRKNRIYPIAKAQESQIQMRRDVDAERKALSSSYTLENSNKNYLYAAKNWRGSNKKLPAKAAARSPFAQFFLPLICRQSF